VTSRLSGGIDQVTSRLKARERMVSNSAHLNLQC
jgi:hypothetical protein